MLHRSSTRVSTSDYLRLTPNFLRWTTTNIPCLEGNANERQSFATSARPEKYAVIVTCHATRVPNIRPAIYVPMMNQHPTKTWGSIRMSLLHLQLIRQSANTPIRLRPSMIRLCPRADSVPEMELCSWFQLLQPKFYPTSRT